VIAFLGVVELTELRQLRLELGDRVGLVDVAGDAAIRTLEDQLDQPRIALERPLEELLQEQVPSPSPDAPALCLRLSLPLPLGPGLGLAVEEPAELRRQRFPPGTTARVAALPGPELCLAVGEGHASRRHAAHTVLDPRRGSAGRPSKGCLSGQFGVA